MKSSATGRAWPAPGFVPPPTATPASRTPSGAIQDGRRCGGRWPTSCSGLHAMDWGGVEETKCASFLRKFAIQSFYLLSCEDSPSGTFDLSHLAT
jgi:hypothetical protein